MRPGLDSAVRIAAEGIPVPQGSSRAFNRGGRIIVTSDNKNLKAWRALVAAEAFRACLGAPSTPFDGPVSVVLTFNLPYPAGAPKRVKRPPTKKPDLDKLVRAVLDSLSGFAFFDDAQVVELAARKFYAHNRPAGVEIEVSPL